MGDDATSAESDLLSLCRSRPVERRQNPSWRTESAARHVGSVALVICRPALAAHTENFRTSERCAALGESSPICTRRRFFHSDGARHTSAANKSHDGAFSRKSAPFSLRLGRPHRVRNANIGEEIARRGHFGGIGFACPPGGLPRAGGQKATVANQVAGVDALAESPWPLTRKPIGADDESARCVILAGSIRAIFCGRCPGRRRENRSW